MSKVPLHLPTTAIVLFSSRGVACTRGGPSVSGEGRGFSNSTLREQRGSGVSTLRSAQDDDEEEDECVDNDEVEADGERDAGWRSCRCACMLRSCASMYAMCASETSSCRLLRGGAAKKERRKTRATEENMVVCTAVNKRSSLEE
ncbi:hypothetical protein EDB84DRAFT_1443199 [Lactarius hengduanensis]|nr:hypothetical protein EDB84DRAFT_1443199 [Lactarius hengduanensis]